MGPAARLPASSDDGDKDAAARGPPALREAWSDLDLVMQPCRSKDRSRVTASSAQRFFFISVIDKHELLLCQSDRVNI